MTLITRSPSIFEADIDCHLQNTLTLDVGIGKPIYVIDVSLMVRSQQPIKPLGHSLFLNLHYLWYSHIQCAQIDWCLMPIFHLLLYSSPPLIRPLLLKTTSLITTDFKCTEIDENSTTVIVLLIKPIFLYCRRSTFYILEGDYCIVVTKYSHESALLTW